jgi:predicted transcriptional regulator
MGTKRVNFRLSEELVEKADLAAEVTYRDRTDIVTAALREYLDRIEDDDSFREAVVELYLGEQIGFEELAAVLGRQDAESVRASKSLLDRGEEIADGLAEL